MKIKLFFSGLFILVFGLLILPQFKLNINGSEFQYPNINLGIVNPKSTLGEPKKGSGIYSTNEYSAQVDFSADSFLSIQEKKDIFQKLLNTIEKRVEYAYLYDIKTYGQITDGNFYIKFDIPQYYEDRESLVSILTANGRISFANDSQVSNNPVSLTDKDIKGLVNVGYDENYGTVLEFKFADSKATALSSAVANSQKYFLMTVDGVYWAVTDNVYTPMVVKAIPFTNALASGSIVTYASIVRTYFLDKPLDHAIHLDSTKTAEIPRGYIQDSVGFLGIVFILSAIGLALFFYISHGLNKTIKFVLMLSSFIVFFVFLLKLQSAVLSINMLTGFTVIYVIAAIVIWGLLKSSSDEVEHNLYKFRDFSLGLFFVLLGVFKLVPNLNVLSDFFTCAITGAATLFIMTALNFKFISQLEININLRKLFRR